MSQTILIAAKERKERKKWEAQNHYSNSPTVHYSITPLLHTPLGRFEHEPEHEYEESP